MLLHDHGADNYIVFNVLLKKMLRASGLKQLNRLSIFYNMDTKVSLPELKIDIYKGYHTSIKHMYGQLLLEVDFTCKIIRSNSVLEYLNEI
jgi:uncharacterized protein YehS (DUF1456 family)